MKPIGLITKKDVQRLRKKQYGTNFKAISITPMEVKEMHEHLKKLYGGARIQMSFAEKIVFRNKSY